MINFLRGWKFEGGFLLIIGAALLVWAATVYLSPQAREARDTQKYLEELQAHCGQYLAKFKVPAAVRFVAEMPQTATGKIQKAILKEMLKKELANR